MQTMFLLVKWFTIMVHANHRSNSLHRHSNAQVVTIKSVDIFLKSTDFFQQADIRMRSHGLRQLVDDSLLQVVNRLVEVDCQNLLSTGLLQIVSTDSNKSASDKLQQA